MKVSKVPFERCLDSTSIVREERRSRISSVRSSSRPRPVCQPQKFAAYLAMQYLPSMSRKNFLQWYMYSINASSWTSVWDSWFASSENPRRFDGQSKVSQTCFCNAGVCVQFVEFLFKVDLGSLVHQTNRASCFVEDRKAQTAVWDRIFGQDEARPKIVKAALIWITYAKRGLRPKELLHPIAVELNPDRFNIQWGLPDRDWCLAF